MYLTWKLRTIRDLLISSKDVFLTLTGDFDGLLFEVLIYFMFYVYE